MSEGAGASRDRRVRVLRFDERRSGEPAQDRVAVEEPLEVRVDGRTLLVTLRTPGDDLDLVRGLLYGEGFVERPDDVVEVRHCDDVPEEARGNVVIVRLREGRGLAVDGSLRSTIVSAACGVCGAATLDAVGRVAPPVSEGPVVPRSLVETLPGRLRRMQRVHDRTGGVHAAALFAADGRLLAAKEDVGRHNAVDKIVGEAMRFGALPLRESLLMVSSRAGFEIVQKARRAGVPIVCAVSAPSSLAVELAEAGGQTLVAFLRGGRFNVYTHPERVVEG